jgi:2,4-dienoyl-CoA reductase-like NADH-dependent reductase (Old Yellow Enzyme family)
MDAVVRELFVPWALGPLSLPNRLAVAPMTRVSATADGLPTPRMADYYAAFADGGFGLVVTEGLYTDKDHAQGYLHQPGLADAAQRDAWAAVVIGVRARGARIVAQLMHAGGLSQGNPHRQGTRAPSAVRPKGQQMAFYRGHGEYAVPQAMSDVEIATAVRGFAESAARAREAGFDGVEVHAANGYLLDQFLSDGINLREDRYGGELGSRLRLAAEVVRAVREAVGNDFVVGVRFSQAKVNDFAHKWQSEDEAIRLFEAVGGWPVDHVHTTEFEAWQPAFQSGPSLAALAKRHAGKPVLANGSLHDVQRAAGMLQRGEADAVSLGRGALANPDWPLRIQAVQPIEPFDPALLSPLADLANADWLRAKPAVCR